MPYQRHVVELHTLSVDAYLAIYATTSASCDSLQTGRSHMVVCMSTGAPPPPPPATNLPDGSFVSPIERHLGAATVPGVAVHPDHMAITLHDTAVAAELLILQQSKEPDGIDIEAANGGIPANGSTHSRHGSGSSGSCNGPVASPSKLQSNGSGGFFGRLMWRSVEAGKAYKDREHSHDSDDVDTPKCE